MYQVCAAKAAGCSLGVEGCRYLNLSGTTTIDGVDDEAEFGAVHRAMGTVGVAEEEANQLWLYIQATLLLGNVDFGSGEGAKVSNLEVLSQAQALLGIAELQAHLESRSLTVRGVTTTIPLTPASAALARDAMAKIMYRAPPLTPSP